MRKVNFNALKNVAVPESWVEKALHAKPKKKPIFLRPYFIGTAASVVVVSAVVVVVSAVVVVVVVSTSDEQSEIVVVVVSTSDDESSALLSSALLELLPQAVRQDAVSVNDNNIVNNLFFIVFNSLVKFLHFYYNIIS